MTGYPTAGQIEAARARLAAAPAGLFVDGGWRPALSGETFETIDPATGGTLATVAGAGPADIDAAVAAARRALSSGAWPAATPPERARMLLRLARLIEAAADEIALVEVLDQGKPYRAARNGDMRGAIAALEYFAGWATKIAGTTLPSSLPGEWHVFTARQPVGVVGQIIPWNFPFAMAVNKIAPALAAGCTVVLKPAEQTPLSALLLARLVAEADFPPGVVNIVTGLGAIAGHALAAHGDVDKLAFTGSTATGRAIVTAALGNMKRVALELGGKSPVIVFEDADVEAATEAAARGIFGNAGQVCVAGSRLFVHRTLYDRVVEGIVRHAQALRLGAGLDPQADMGPLVSAAQRDRVLGLIEEGRRQGAEVVTGGTAPDRQGCFVEPTVLANVDPAMSVMREEIFGPVLCVTPFDDWDVDTAAAAANDTRYGLSASIWTRDLSRAHRLARRIDAGSVRVNAMPMGDFAVPVGGFKQSGWGRELGREGIEAYTEIKSVVMRL